MEFSEDDMPCGHTQGKICKNCESSTKEFTTGKMYCCNVPWLYLLLFGPRPVAPTNTCSKCALKKAMEKSR